VSAEVVQLESRIDWLRERRKGIGASDAAAIIGLSPYSNPFITWLDKTGQLPLDHGAEEPGERWGRFLEGAIADAFEAETGLHVVNRGLVVVHPEHEWMRATLDGHVAEGPTRTEPAGIVLGVYEAKTTNGRDGTWKDGPPEWYHLQVQHQLAVTGLDRAWVPVLIGGSDFEVHEIQRDEKVVRLLLKYESEFWFDNVLAGVPPAVDGSERTGDALRRLYARPQRSECELPDHAAGLVRQYLRATAVEKASKQQAEKAKNELMALLGDAEVGLVDGRPLVQWPLVTSRRLDVEALRAAHPDIAEQFTRPSECRRFTAVKETA
jgi:putative phage-type endonuclease